MRSQMSMQGLYLFTIACILTKLWDFSKKKNDNEKKQEQEEAEQRVEM